MSAENAECSVGPSKEEKVLRAWCGTRVSNTPTNVGYGFQYGWI